MTFEIRVEVLDFKNSVASTVVPSEDGCYTIVLNSRMCYNRMHEAYRHEIEHIKRLDFENRYADIIERDTHE